MKDMGLDFAKLDEAGFALLPIAVGTEDLAVFEDQIARLGKIECRKHGIDAGDSEALAAALSLGGNYRTMLFNKIKQLGILQAITQDLIAQLRVSGAFTRLGIDILSYYQTLKGDLPNDHLFDLPYHQDYLLTRSHRAYRAWISLRDANRVDGSVEFAVGSHHDAFEYQTGENGYRHIPENQIAGRFDMETIEFPAGGGVLFNPLIVHRSVPNRGKRMKFALIIQIEDAASLANPFDANDKLAKLIAL